MLSDPTCDWTPLPDVSDQLIADMRDKPALDRAIQRLVRSLADPNGVISAFSSFVE